MISPDFSYFDFKQSNLSFSHRLLAIFTLQSSDEQRHVIIFTFDIKQTNRPF
jgi:hypothetical protein